MSNICKRISRQSKKARQMGKKAVSYKPQKKYTSFNIFTRDGQNITVKSNRPMTIEEAQYHYKALSISGND